MKRGIRDFNIIAPIIGISASEATLSATKCNVFKLQSDYSSALAVFEQRGKEWARQGLDPSLMVRAAQFVSGIALGDQGRSTLHGWAEEEIARLDVGSVNRMEQPMIPELFVEDKDGFPVIDADGKEIDVLPDEFDYLGRPEADVMNWKPETTDERGEA
ncbi:MAG: hypothetical protein WC498_02075 [Candidatus Saccharimonadales bacterium]